jgi:hypothetical protein
MRLIGVALLALGVQVEAHAHGFGAARGGVAAGRGGFAAGRAAGGVAVGPLGGVQAGGARGGTYVGPRGTTIQAGQVGGVGVGPLGGVYSGGVEGARVTTPGGRTFTTGLAGGIGVGPAGGVREFGAGGTAVHGPYGGAVGRAGGVAIGPFGGVGVGGARVAEFGHATRYVSPAGLRTQGAYVRGGFGYSCFTPAWYRAHPVAWVAPRWRAANFWVAPAWPVVSTYCGITAPPIWYDYGSSIVIQDNYVYSDGAQLASVEQYADQAEQFADRGRQALPAQDDEWQPLGVFGMIQGDEKVAQHIFQLALNKAGIVRGNYYDAVADNTLPVYGSVDARTQRVAWSVGEKKTVVFEAGLNNLTQDQTTVLVHYGKERSDQMVLVRLEDPAQANRQPAP